VPLIQKQFFADQDNCGCFEELGDHVSCGGETQPCGTSKQRASNVAPASNQSVAAASNQQAREERGQRSTHAYAFRKAVADARRDVGTSLTREPARQRVYSLVLL
jgi:hypothetical protein